MNKIARGSALWSVRTCLEPNPRAGEHGLDHRLLLMTGTGGGGEDVGDGGEGDGGSGGAAVGGGGDPEEAVGGEDEEAGFEEGESSWVVFFALHVDGGEEGALHLAGMEHRPAAFREFRRS